MSASMLRRIYDGWEDMWQNFIATRWLWASGDQNWASSHQTFSDVVQKYTQSRKYLSDRRKLGDGATAIRFNVFYTSRSWIRFYENDVCLCHWLK